MLRLLSPSLEGGERGCGEGEGGEGMERCRGGDFEEWRGRDVEERRGVGGVEVAGGVGGEIFTL